MLKQIRNLILLTTVLLANSSCFSDSLQTKDKVGFVSVSELYKLKPILKEKQKRYTYSGTLEWSPEFSIRCFVGTWCHDTKRELPRILKVLDEAEFPEEKIEIILLSKNKKEPSKEVKQYRVFYTPTIIILKNGVEVERFVEHPYSNWVDDLNRVFSK